MTEKDSNREIEEQAIQLALQFQKAAKTKKWFKPLHIVREVKGETKETIEAKLAALMTMDLCASKEMNGEMKYMITISNEQRVKYLNEYLDWLNQERLQAEQQIEKYST